MKTCLDPLSLPLLAGALTPACTACTLHTAHWLSLLLHECAQADLLGHLTVD